MTEWKKIPHGARKEIFKALLDMSKGGEDKLADNIVEFIEKRDAFIEKYIKGDVKLDEMDSVEVDKIYVEFNKVVDFTMGMSRSISLSSPPSKGRQ